MGDGDGVQVGLHQLVVKDHCVIHPQGDPLDRQVVAHDDSLLQPWFNGPGTGSGQRQRTTSGIGRVAQRDQKGVPKLRLKTTR